jgi:Na+/H+ antiporter NhaD/arsenite permease-like protein
MTLSILLVAIFVAGYLAIAFEHNIRINKTASALITGVLCWTVYVLFTSPEAERIVDELSEHLAETSEILFFLLGAMTIVELIDAHQGFKVVTDSIKTRDRRALLWILSLVTFFLSAVLDNLTTSIVMVSLLRKLIGDTEQRKFYAGVVIIAANAGGAWSPLGDVTTTMLWIGGQITALNIIKLLIIPSLVCLAVPLLFLSFRMKGQLAPVAVAGEEEAPVHDGRKVMLAVGMACLLFVPVFKTITHLPPYMGILLSLGVIWIVSEVINSKLDEEEKAPYTAMHALSRIDTSSVLFFLGILLAIGALEATHLLSALAGWMDRTIGNQDVIVMAIGLASAVIDNVPLVAATMGMYSLDVFPPDVKLWEFLAYCAGTGGSVLIIGSAAGVAVMGMEKIDFGWYLKRISLLALLGYFAGAFAYLGIYAMMH